MPDIATAYKNALYVIETNPPIILRVGTVNTDLGLLYQQLNCSHGVFMTACNPYSRLLRPAANNRRLIAMQKRINTYGYSWLPATGKDQKNSWPNEPGFWVINMPINQAITLARSFSQNAILHTDESTNSQLIWI